MKIPEEYIKLIETAVNKRVEELTLIVKSYELIPDGTVMNDLAHWGYKLAKDDIAAYQKILLHLSEKQRNRKKQSSTKC
jgi:predicted metal-dependent enzyme (double-stranded beta helix superfamily)